MANDATSPLHALFATSNLRSWKGELNATAFAKSAPRFLHARDEPGSKPTGLPRLTDEIPYEICATVTAIRGIGIGVEGKNQDEP